MNDIKPISSLNSSIIKKLEPIIEKLSDDPKEIAIIAQSNGDNMLRLACCLKLIRLYYQAIPLLRVSGKENPCIDEINPNFEDELTISMKYPSNSITTIFTCCLIAAGQSAIKHYFNSHSSPNPFAQCLRIIFRITWFLKVRKTLLCDLRAQNHTGILNNSMRLTSFRDFCVGAQRAAIFYAVSHHNSVNLRMFAYYVPRRFLTDTVRNLYNDFKEHLSASQKEEFMDLEVKVDQIIKSKMNPTYFSATTSLEDTILYSFPIDKLYEDQFEDFMSGYLFEIAPDKELEIFRKYFLAVANSSLKIKIAGVKRRFDLVHIINFDSCPSAAKAQDRSRETKEEKRESLGDGFLNMFKPRRDFIADTKHMYKKNKFNAK